MGILDRIFNRGQTATDDPAEDLPPRECLHVALMPHWDELGDMGDEEKASRFECASCGTSFDPAKAAELRATEAARIKGEAAAQN